jgi:uncharacterized membrane protein YphA (DoxX/SURF4 family)
MSVNEAPRAATRGNPALDAYRILRLTFVVAPVVLGLDKFFNALTQWPKFLAPIVANNIPPETFMRGVGIVEIAAGLLVLLKPRIGAYVVAAWLLVIIVNLLLIPGYYDVAVRDFGLMLAALALGKLSGAFKS